MQATFSFILAFSLLQSGRNMFDEIRTMYLWCRKQLPPLLNLESYHSQQTGKSKIIISKIII